MIKRKPLAAAVLAALSIQAGIALAHDDHRHPVSVKSIEFTATPAPTTEDGAARRPGSPSERRTENSRFENVPDPDP